MTSDFNNRVSKLLEDFNVYPRAKKIDSRPAPVAGKNINFTGTLPTGFKGAGLPGIAPGQESTVLVKLPQKKKKKKTT